jgi:hypothetical protein
VGFDAHAPLVRYLVVAIRAEILLVAAIAVLGVILRLDGMDGDKVGPMRCGHGLTFSRQTLLQVGFDIPASVAVETEGLLVTVQAIGGGSFRQQSVLSGPAMIVHFAGAAMTVPTGVQLAGIVFLVVGPGE